MKRPDVPNGAGKGGSVDLPVGKLLGKCDRLNDLLCSGAWDDGAAKGERSLFLFISSSMVRVLTKVESPPLKLSAVGRSIDEALVALDALLGAVDVPWEPDAPRQNGGAKKKK